MLEIYRDTAKSILLKGKSFNLSDCILTFELSVTQASESLVSTLTCNCTKNSYEKFLESLNPDKITEIIPDFSLIPGSLCPELSLISAKTGENIKFNWTKPYYCLFIWGSWSANCKHYLSLIESIAKETSEIEIVSLCLGENPEISSENPESYLTQSFKRIAEQGLEISEFPSCFLLKNGKIYAKLDLTSDIKDKIFDLLQGKPIKIELNIGNSISFLTLSNGILNLSDDHWHLILFPSNESDYFLRHLNQIQDENPEWAEKLKLTVIEKADESSIELLVIPGIFLIVHKSEIQWKADVSSTDIYHMLKNLLNPTFLTRDEFYEKKSRLEYSQSQWQQKYPTCPLPTVRLLFSKRFLFNSESNEEKEVRLEGSFLTCHKEYVEEFFEILASFFPNALNCATYEAPSHTISAGEQCSNCDELLEKTHYLCVYCKPALYFCENCFDRHFHPLFRFTEEVLGLDNLTWGAFNLNVGKIDDGVHLEVLCNLCIEKISGVRWKCAVCNDFDICNQCLKENKNHAKHHIMIRIAA